jgi:hypothetical protein
MSLLLAVLWACGEPSPPEAPIAAPAPAAEPPAPPPAATGVQFLEPADGATVRSPVKVRMGVAGMEVRRAGEMIDGTGHHHVLVDLDPIAAGQQIVKDETHIHFGGAETEAEVTLAPGVHRLTLQFADANHMSYGPEWARTITVTVE